MSYVKCALGVVGALGLFATANNARAVTLADLIASGTPVVAGDKIFSDFVVGGSLPASAVTVNFVANSGVQFTANWNTLTPGANQSVISYTVTVNPASGNVITGANLFFGGQVVVSNGTASVGETLTDAAHSKDYSLQVLYDGPGGKPDVLRASTTIDPSVTSLRVVKSIDVNAGDGNSFAALNFVENTFVQSPGQGTPPPVPEPMSLALLPLALAGLGLRKKLARN